MDVYETRCMYVCTVYIYSCCRGNFVLIRKYYLDKGELALDVGAYMKALEVS